MTIRVSGAGRKKNVIHLSKKRAVSVRFSNVAEDMWRTSQRVDRTRHIRACTLSYADSLLQRLALERRSSR